MKRYSAKFNLAKQTLQRVTLFLLTSRSVEAQWNFICSKHKCGHLFIRRVGADTFSLQPLSALLCHSCVIAPSNPATSYTPALSLENTETKEKSWKITLVQGTWVRSLNMFLWPKLSQGIFLKISSGVGNALPPPPEDFDPLRPPQVIQVLQNGC